jgi:hypothetical protein
MDYIVETLLALFNIAVGVTLVTLAGLLINMFVLWHFFIPSISLALMLGRGVIAASIILLLMYMFSNEFKLAIIERKSR